MGGMKSKRRFDRNSILILLIPTGLVVAGLVWGFVVRSPSVVFSMLLLLGAVLLGFRQSRQARRREEAAG